MLFRFGIPILLCHSEIDDMDDISGLRVGTADEEVVGFDISIDEIFLVDGLDS